MSEFIDVQIGEVKVASGDGILRANALGSCIGVAVFDPAARIGAMAHIMLPGKAPAKDDVIKHKYAVDAIQSILEKITSMGSNTDNIIVALVGGGNVLQREDDSICRDNIDSVLDIIKQKELNVAAEVLGGVKRKSVILDIQKQSIFFTEGNSGVKQLWKAS